MSEIKDFTHLHVHSVYSILDGENKIEAICNQVKALGMNKIALTDHGTMMGSLEFYKQCKASGVKPILGVEAYVTNDVDDLENSDKTRDNFHLVMIAENQKGLENLFWLTSQAQLHNFYFKPRISKHNMTPDRMEGIIATSACLGCEVNRKGGWEEACPVYTIDSMMEVAAWYKEAFKGKYHLEIQDNDDALGQQKAYNAAIKQVGRELDIPLVITSDAHYTTLEQSEMHGMLMAMQLKKTMEEYLSTSEMRYGPWFYIRSPEAMLEAAIKYDCEEAFWNTCSIGDRCNVEITIGDYKPPEFNIKDDPDYIEFLKTRHIEEH